MSPQVLRKLPTCVWKCVLVLTCISLAPVSSDDAMDFHKYLPARMVWAVLGQDAELPCNITPPTANDRVNMVLWFKDSAVPLYTVDARHSGTLSEAEHSAISDDLGGRSYFQAEPGRLGALVIHNVSVEDEGIFRCRIDFVNSPTRNFRINLTVAVPPSTPVVYDAADREVTGVAGPFREDFELFLSCRVNGGRPKPTVWWEGGGQRYRSEEWASKGQVVSRLIISAVPRVLYNSHLTCFASNKMTPPVSKKVPLDMYLKLQKVAMGEIPPLLSAGKVQPVHCEAWGSVPPARISWLLDGRLVRDDESRVSLNLNSSSSTLLFQPRASDDGKELSCRAINPEFPGGFREDHRTIRVAFPPVLSLKIEASLSNIKEGDNVAFICDVKANPKPDFISWYHGEKELVNNKSLGVRAEGRGLVLGGVAKGSSGDYSCAAANSEGQARSLPISIRVQYAPRCRVGRESQRLGALRHDTVTANCEVDADPRDDIRFAWTLQRFGDVLHIPAHRAVSLGVSSKLQYSPISDQDFGTLQCWASNRVGKQTTPCLFHVVPARLPSRPENCTVRNRTSGGLEVVCDAGDDGDLQQHFVLEWWSEAAEAAGAHPAEPSDQAPGPPPHTASSYEPRFALHSLRPGVAYQLAVFSANARGRSQPVIIPHVRLPATQHNFLQHGKQEEVDEGGKVPMSIVLGVLVGAAVLVLTGVSVAAALLVCRRRRRGATPPSKRSSTRGSRPASVRFAPAPFEIVDPPAQTREPDLLMLPASGES